MKHGRASGKRRPAAHTVGHSLCLPDHGGGPITDVLSGTGPHPKGAPARTRAAGQTRATGQGGAHGSPASLRGPTADRARPA
ncbi:snapalysin family zinc-dependent metalloprotease [Streptomyces thermoalcalitolerans]|uniref:snapalysin family zinc-dependent metalloprotease n=1 Tax=Streptomyces thermoalcalitolerans TaxID=65605 RepID=UPI003CD09FA5